MGVPMLTIRDVRAGDVEYLVKHIRVADRNEVAVASGRIMKDILPLSVQISRKCEILENSKGHPVAIYGVTDGQPPEPYSPPYGVVWLLATSEIESSERIPFIRISRSLIARVMLPQYDFIHNYCWARNYQAIDWLKWCGFEMLHPVRVGPFNERFFPFYLWNDEPCATQSQ